MYKRQGQGDALAHAAGELVGSQVGGVAQVDEAQQLPGTPPTLPRGHTGEPESELLVDHFRLPVFLICAALAEAGYEVADPLWAGGGFCGSLDDPEVLYGRAETTDTEVAVRLIADGRSHAEDFAAATAHPVPPLSLKHI